MTNVCYSHPETSDKPHESWIIQAVSHSCSAGLSSAQVPVPAFLSLYCTRRQPRTPLLLFCPTAQINSFWLGLAGLLSAQLEGLSGVGITLIAGLLPVSGHLPIAVGSALQ